MAGQAPAKTGSATSMRVYHRHFLRSRTGRFTEPTEPSAVAFGEGGCLRLMFMSMSHDIERIHPDTLLTYVFGSRFFPCCVQATTLQSIDPGAPQTSTNVPKRILVLYSYNHKQPAQRIIFAGIQIETKISWGKGPNLDNTEDIVYIVVIFQ